MGKRGKRFPAGGARSAKSVRKRPPPRWQGPLFFDSRGLPARRAALGGTYMLVRIYFNTNSAAMTYTSTGTSLALPRAALMML